MDDIEDLEVLRSCLAIIVAEQDELVGRHRVADKVCARIIAAFKCGVWVHALDTYTAAPMDHDRWSR